MTIKRFLFCVITSCLLLICGFGSVFAQEAADPDAQVLLKRMDDARFPHSYEMKITMNTTRPGRDDLYYEYDIIGTGTDKSLMTVTEPPRERDKQILLNEDNLWFFVPDVSRPVKLTRKASFMNSTFSNEDVMNSTLADDYTAHLLSREVRETGPHFTIELRARTRSVAYAKMIAGIDSATAIPDTIVYFGLSGKALKEMVSLENKMLAGRLRPSVMVMYDYLEEGASTEVIIETLVEVADIPETTFDPTRMGK